MCCILRDSEAHRHDRDPSPGMVSGEVAKRQKGTELSQISENGTSLASVRIRLEDGTATAGSLN